MQQLLAAGCDVKARSDDGRSAWNFATAGGHAVVVQQKYLAGATLCHAAATSTSSSTHLDQLICCARYTPSLLIRNAASGQRMSNPPRISCRILLVLQTRLVFQTPHRPRLTLPTTFQVPSYFLHPVEVRRAAPTTRNWHSLIHRPKRFSFCCDNAGFMSYFLTPRL